MSGPRKAVINLYCYLHHLILREKLQNDGEEDAVLLCSVCEERVTGAAYKCVICNFLVDVSCIEQRKKGNWHCLFFTEELKNEGEKKFVCSGCEEPVRHSAYICSNSECKFLLDKSCGEASRQIRRHPIHPDHTLFIRGPSRTHRCDCCRKDCERRFLYRCGACNFDLCIKCASLWRTDIGGCGEHKFFLISKKRILYICDVCSKVCRTDRAYLCSSCRILVDYECATSTVHASKRGTVSKVLHDLMEDSIDTTLGVRFQQKIKEFESPINHLSHQHNLSLMADELKEDKVCEGCMQLITSAHEFYCCIQCNFFTHRKCAELPEEIKSPFHDHKLSFLPVPPYPGGAFTCDMCRHFRHGFVYRCNACEYNIDVHCAFLRNKIILHPGHDCLKSNILEVASVPDRRCNACLKFATYTFACYDCKFAACVVCATLPFVVTHRYDTHHLTLTYKAEDDSGEYYCQICEEERDPNTWFYYCKECDFAAHPMCVLGNYPYLKFGQTYTHETHQHPITFVQTTQYSSPCDHCNKCFDGVALECRECNLKLHPPHTPGLTGCSQMLREDKKQSPDNLRLLMLRKDKQVMGDPSE
ncbi:hypothetical protein CJ030_MR5G003536 [Morella rubra]|uniref:Phorbol-ester/DAG-type domain-containing protein n=1 Tax=Morella rubra TaxID=262757 RepID=A0A6A1VKX6_9ROSI|nr:hypothetical protein CJ030_MR5G003536 [Morella rubra]